MTIEMVYSEKFKSRMVGKMVGLHAVSASVLAAEVGIGQPTLSRWLREARTVPDMAKKSRRSKQNAHTQRPQDWSPEEKLRVVVESTGLTDEDLGAFLRERGLFATDGEFLLFESILSSEGRFEVQRKGDQLRAVSAA